MIASSCSILSVDALKLNAVNAEDEAAKVINDGVNPDFVSSMTSNHWKLYQPSETLSMYSRSEYKANKQSHIIQELGVKQSNANDNLDQAKAYLRQAENTIVKLKTELKDYAA